MASITQYKTKAGTKFWKFQAYGGVNPNTGKRAKVTRQGFRTKKEAQLRAARFETETARHGFSESSVLTFQDVYNSWFAQYKNTVKEASWAKTQDNFRLHVLPVFGDKLLKSITPIDCQEAVNKWFKAGFSKYQTFLNLVSRIFRYAIRMDLIFNDPTKKVIVPKNRNKPVTTMANNYYDLDELKQFFQALEDQDDQQEFTFFRLLAFSGMRKGEALALQWSDIDFDQDNISIKRTQSRGEHGVIVNSPKTYNSIRTVNVDKKTLGYLKKWRWQQRENFLAYGVHDNGADQLVFSTRYNTIIGPARPVNWLRDLSHQYGLKYVSPHGFRRTYATLAFESGLSIKDVQVQLGHRNYQTTADIYTEVTRLKKEETASIYAHYVNF